MNHTVLCIEDEEDYQLLVQKILGRAEINVQVADTGGEGMRLLQDEKPGAVLLDVNLPDEDGYELCTQIRKLYGSDELPIIMLTVRRRPEEWLKGFSSGASDYIVKPFNPSQLTERVLYHLNEKACQSHDAMSAEYRLIRAAVAGNRSAYDVLIQKYRKRLVESLAGAVRNDTHMEDVISHSLAVALERLPDFRGESAFFTWLYRIAMNECIATYRRPTPLSLETVLEDQKEHILPGFSCEKAQDESLVSLQMQDQARKSYEQLPQPYRKMLELYCLKDFSYEAIAKKMRIPQGTVMSRLHKARRLLQDAWSKTPAALPE